MQPRLPCLFVLSVLLLSGPGCPSPSVDGTDCSFYPGSWIDVLAVTCAWELVEEGAWQSRVVVEGVFWERIAGFQPLELALDVDGAELRDSEGELGDTFSLVLDPVDPEARVNIDFGCEDRSGGVRLSLIHISEPTRPY